MHRWWHRVLIVVLVFSFFPLSAQAYDFNSCVNCHKAKLGEDNSRSYLHSPFKEGRCGDCHAVAVDQENTGGSIDHRRIDWLAESAMVDTSHGFVLPGSKLGNTLVVELHGPSSELPRKDITVPPLAGLSEVKDSGKPPSISQVRVLKVERGLFLSATIGWQTDTLASASVRYGNGEVSRTSESGSRLARRHQIALPNLLPDTQYRFTAISRDLFGRSQVSELMTFSTAKPFTATITEASTPLAGDIEQTEISSRFHRFGADYLIELTLNQPASIFIGSTGGPRCFPDDEIHEGLSCGAVSSAEACLNCHSAHMDLINASSPQPEITIPPEYPTLPGGRIACTSCHAPHSSDYVYYKRKPSDNELCAGCHLSGFGTKK
jgi:predicted CXXCH cytochrome family protein